MCYDLGDISPTIARLFDIPPHPLWEGKPIDPVLAELRGTERILVMLLDGFGFWEYQKNRQHLRNFVRFFDQGVTSKIKASMYPLTPICFHEIFYGQRRNVEPGEDVFETYAHFPDEGLLPHILEKNGITTAFIGYDYWTEGYGKSASLREKLEIDWEDFNQSPAIIPAILRALEAEVTCIFAIDTAYDLHGETANEANMEIERLVLDLERIHIKRKCGILVLSDHGDHDETWQHYKRTKEIVVFNDKVLDALISARGAH